jgi:hypothetical protein
MLEKETKWQQVLLYNIKVKGEKFSLFLRTIVAATKLYIKAMFQIHYVFFSSSSLTTIYSHGFYFCYNFYLGYLTGSATLSLFLIGLVHVGLGFD